MPLFNRGPTYRNLTEQTDAFSDESANLPTNAQIQAIIDAQTAQAEIDARIDAQNAQTPNAALESQASNGAIRTKKSTFASLRSIGLPSIRPRSSQAKITLLVGMLCLIVAIILMLLPQSHGQSEVPLWVASSVMASLTCLTSIYYIFNNKTANATCDDLFRLMWIKGAVVTTLISCILATQPKYQHFTMTIAPEIILALVAYLFWKLTWLIDTEKKKS